jgi:shikimate kinase
MASEAGAGGGRERPPPARLFLVGFMGAGKSTVGPLVAEALGFGYVDLDAALERRVGTTVRRYFATRGEARFRRVERETLRALLREPCDLVVALGGGAFADRSTRAVVRRAGLSVWLDAPAATLARRALGDPKRPLASTPRRFFALLRARRAAYRTAAIRISTRRRDPEALACEIAERFRTFSMTAGAVVGHTVDHERGTH